jgi:hypothetical protein
LILFLAVTTEGDDDVPVDEEIKDEEMAETLRACDILPPKFRGVRGRPRIQRLMSKGEVASRKVKLHPPEVFNSINVKN